MLPEEMGVVKPTTFAVLSQVPVLLSFNEPGIGGGFGFCLKT